MSFKFMKAIWHTSRTLDCVFSLLMSHALNIYSCFIQSTLISFSFNPQIVFFLALFFDRHVVQLFIYAFILWRIPIEHCKRTTTRIYATNPTESLALLRFKKPHHERGSCITKIVLAFTINDCRKNGLWRVFISFMVVNIKV